MLDKMPLAADAHAPTYSWIQRTSQLTEFALLKDSVKKLERASRERLLEPRLRHERRARVDLPRPVDVVGHDDDFGGCVDRDAARLGRPDLPLANISTDNRDVRPGKAPQRRHGRCLLLFRHRDAAALPEVVPQPQVGSWRAVLCTGPGMAPESFSIRRQINSSGL